MKNYIGVVIIAGRVEKVPVQASDLAGATNKLKALYGASNVKNVRPA